MVDVVKNGSGVRTDGAGLILNPRYLQPYPFEVYDAAGWYGWMERRWTWVAVPVSILYVLLIFLGQRYMSRREAFSLRLPLLLWNVSLALGSFWMFLRMVAEPVEEIKVRGFYQTICSRENHTVISSFWCLIFTLSKVLEFGDTGFIVLRKQKLIFLHPWHHVTVMLYTFYTFGPTFDPAGRVFGPSNALIHSFMYLYYASKSLRLKVPQWVSKGITSMQILQMIGGLWVNLLSFFGKAVWGDCNHRPWSNIAWALAMYTSYLVLFLKFFVASYGRRGGRGGKVINNDNKLD
ncbi:putative fatty acid elongation protein 4 [Folsomia candida]|uniref:Elongation of very long chain fatty acids protein n=1 Tax=Folsomia candida TaxID=158441 RepID=A0A226EZC9_FOLCA|nr:putative fatty acid elongation protein 4 [Folsomia candida]OXA62548.1 putative fatty acid elongation protein 4 [Folsomia candida]